MSESPAPVGDAFEFERIALERADAGDYAGAMAAMARAAQLAPARPCLEQAIPWLHRPGQLDELTIEWAAQHLLRPLIELVQEIPPDLPEHDPRRANIDAAAHICRVLAERWPERAIVHVAVSVLDRRAGLFDEAIELALKAYRVEPTVQTAMTLAHAYRDAGRLREALKTYQHALRLDPQQRIALPAIADIALRVGHWEAATRALEALERRGSLPAHLKGALVFARYRLHGRAEDRLAALRHAEQGDALVQRLFIDERPLRWGLTKLGVPARTRFDTIAVDQLTASLRTARLGQLGDQPLVFATSGVQSVPPSLWLAVRRAAVLGGHGGPVLIEPSLAIPPPALATRWLSADGLPLYGPPDERAYRLIRLLADEPFELELWSQLASAQGQQLGPEWIHELMVAATYPGAVKPDVDPFSETFTVLVAACFLSLYAGPADKAQLEVSRWCLDGIDWLADAALLALLAWTAIGVPEFPGSHERLPAVLHFLGGPRPDALGFPTPATVSLAKERVALRGPTDP